MTNRWDYLFGDDFWRIQRLIDQLTEAYKITDHLLSAQGALDTFTTAQQLINQVPQNSSLAQMMATARKAQAPSHRTFRNTVDQARIISELWATNLVPATIAQRSRTISSQVRPFDTAENLNLFPATDFHAIAAIKEDLRPLFESEVFHSVIEKAAAANDILESAYSSLHASVGPSLTNPQYISRLAKIANEALSTLENVDFGHGEGVLLVDGEEVTEDEILEEIQTINKPGDNRTADAILEYLKSQTASAKLDKAVKFVLIHLLLPFIISVASTFITPKIIPIGGQKPIKIAERIVTEQ